VAFRSSRDRPAVIGIGTTTYGRLPDHDATSLGIWALNGALDDCGLEKDAIDALIFHRITDYQKFVRVTGLHPRFVSASPPQGRMSGVTLQMAASLILSGAARTVAIVYGNDGRSGGARYGGLEDRYGTDAQEFWFPYGMSSPGAVHALLFQRHRHLYGTTTEQLAEIAVAFRGHAELNPHAVMRKPITVEEHETSRFICNPLRLLDYCIINDGGVAMILSASDMAKDFKQPPVYLRGFSVESRLAEGEFADDFGRSCMAAVARRTYEMAEVSRDDIDTFQIYDNFTSTVLFNIEGYGFCKPGEGGAWLQEGHLRLGGRYPSNTSGGQLSESYMQGWSLNVEAVRQVRRSCGSRQVKDAELAQYISGGPISTSVIYGRDLN
jgi:acetyl-CoA acetyltransferase